MGNRLGYGRHILLNSLGLALAILLRPPDARCMLAGPSLHGLAVSASEVAVRVDKRVLFFDYEGAFRHEMTTRELPIDRSRLLALTDDGQLWVAYVDEDKEGNVKASTVAALDDSGGLALRHRMEGQWTFFVTRNGAVFAGQVADKRLTVQRMDATSGRLTPYASVGIEKALRILDLDTASAVAWAVDEHGDLFVLTTAAERGRVTRYRPNGEQVRVWDVLPDPVTSVSYIRDVLLDRDGVPYVTHSSWEVSSSLGNDGSVIRLDPAGGEPLRIKEGIGYLQHAAIAPSGDVFVTDLSEEVFRFSASGERVLSWVAVPPRAGETWEGRRQHIADARRVGPTSSVSDLVNALVYGDWKIAERARRWLVARGAPALPEVTAAAARLGRVPGLQSAAETLWDAHPNAAARLFVETQDDAVRRVLAPSLGWSGAPPPGLRELLSRMVLEGDDRARYALNNLGPTPEVVRARIAELRQCRRTGKSCFDAEWDLKQGYAASISALEAILMSREDPERRDVRALMLEASLDATHELDGKPKAVQPAIVTRTQSWVTHQDPFVRETAAVALTAFGIAGHQEEAIAGASRDAALVLPTLQAFATFARMRPGSVAPHVPALLALARSAASGRNEDPLREFGHITDAAVTEACLKLVVDETLPLARRATVLSAIRPDAVPRPELLGFLGDLTWQRQLVTEYSYHSFVENVLKVYPEDTEVRRETKSVLLALLAEASELPKRTSSGHRERRAILLDCLYPLVTNDDGPRLTALVADPELDKDSRWQIMRLISRVVPDGELRERLLPLLQDSDLRLAAAQALGRIGEHAALKVLVDDGLKRLGFYSNVELEVESFRPLGAEAEEALLSLLDYPNQGTRQAARLFLVQWPSADGRRRIRAEFDRAIEAGQAPQSYDLTALALAGEPILEPLIKLVTEHPEALEELEPSHEDGPLSVQVCKALSVETDQNRITALRALAKRLCGCTE